MADIALIKRNLSRMIDQGAPEADLNEYLGTVGFKSPEQFRAASKSGGVTGDNLAQAFGGGATFNFGDELTAGVRAALPDFSNWMMRGPALQRDESIGGSPQAQTVSTAPDFQGRYDEELAKEREKLKNFQTSNPVAAGAANVAGGLATTALALPAAATAVGPSAIMNVAKTAGVGAALGGAAGFGEGEGTEDRLTKGAIGGAIGGGVGALTRPLAAVGRSVAESAPGRMVLDPINNIAQALLGRAGNARAAAQGIRPPEPPPAPTLSAEQGAAQRLATTFQRDRLTPEAAQAELARLGPEAIPSDISQSLLQQGVNAKTLPGETRQLAQDFFSPREGVGRIGRTGDRMVQAAEGNAPPPSHFALTGEGQVFDQNLRAVGQRAYGAMEEAGFKNSPGISRFLEESPEVSKAVERVLASEQAARAGTNRAPASIIDVMHKVKREIQNLGLEPSGRPSSTAHYWQQTSDDFVRTLKAANPELAAADRAYAEAASLPERYTAGASIFKRGMGEQATESSAPGIADLLQNSTAQQAAATRAGAINAVRDKAQTLTGARGLARDIAFGGGENGVQQSIRTALPNEAENLIRQSGTEGIFANTANRYQGGPHTADDLLGAAADLGNNISLKGTEHGVFPRIQEGLRSAVNWVASPNEAVRNQIGRMLLDANPETQRRTLDLIAQILQQRAAGTPVAAGLAQAGGGLAGREASAIQR